MGVTATAAEVPATELLTASAAVTVWLPAVFSATLKVWTPPSEEATQLSRALARHEALTAKKVRETQQLRATLASMMPLVDQAIDEMDAKWARALVRAMPTPHHATTMTRE